MKEHILNTSVNLFSEKEYERLGMDDIAEAAGISMQSLYIYFTEKAQILVEILKRMERRLEADILDCVAKLPTPEERSLGIVGLCVDVMTDYRNIADLVIKEQPAESQVTDTIRIIKTQFFNLISYLINEGITAGLFRSCNSRITSECMLCFTYTYCRRLEENGPFDKKKAALLINKFIMHGLTL